MKDKEALPYDELWHIVDGKWIHFGQITKGSVRKYYTNGKLERSVDLNSGKYGIDEWYLYSFGKDQIGEYLERVNAKISPLVKAIHYAQGKLLKLKRKGRYIYPFIKVSKNDNEKYMYFFIHSNGIWEYVGVDEQLSLNKV